VRTVPRKKKIRYRERMKRELSSGERFCKEEGREEGEVRLYVTKGGAKLSFYMKGGSPIGIFEIDRGRVEQ